MNAAEAGQIVAQFIEKSWPNDRDSIFQILDLVQETIWKSGLFEGSTKWATVKVRKDGTIVTPHMYPILIGAKKDHTKFDIKGSYFMFHENGPLKDPDESDHFSKNIQFLGSYPTLINHTEDTKVSRASYNIGVISECLPPSGSPPLTTISATNRNGRNIYTYRFKEKVNPEFIEEDAPVEFGPDDVSIQHGVIEGIVYPITNRLITFDNVDVSEIYNITKETSLASVDYYLFDSSLKDCCTRKGVLIASLDPFQTVSRYNTYRVVNSCVRGGTIYGLFKKDRPEKLVNDYQHVLINSKIGLISLAKAMQFTYFKDNVAKGEQFLEKGMEDISNELRASNPGIINTLQIRDETKSATKRNFR